MVIFEKSRTSAKAHAQIPKVQQSEHHIPEHLLREDKPLLPELSDL